MKSHLLVALIAADVAFSIVSIAFATLPLPLSFWRLRFIFPPILLCWHGAVFPHVSSPFFAFFALKAKQCANHEIGGSTKCPPMGDKIESPLANGCLLM
jgi:hypothetical protein